MPTIPRAPKTVPFGDAIQSAIAFAAEKHRNHYRKRQRAGVHLPYIVHPLEVLKLIWQWETVTGEMAMAAVLHDTLEDTETTPGELSDRFGWAVMRLVEELTCMVPDDTPYPEELRIKAEYMQSFGTKSVEALVIKVADRICNVRDFMLTDERYAAEYWGKAKAVRVVFEQRYDEIEREFGEGPAQHMSGTIKHLEWQLEQVEE